MTLLEFSTENTYLLNSLWVFLAAVLVFLMQAGFACCESGFARSKSAVNIWMKNAVDFCVGALIYYFIGFGLMYGDDFMGMVGINGFINPLSQNLAVWDGLGLSREAFILFQTVFCATAATIISGSVAERFKFNSYIIVSVVMTGFIYPVVGHWIWGGGWLSSLGFVDYAGSAAVHCVGAFASLVGASMVGARYGKYTKGDKGEIVVNAIPKHNIPMIGLGVFILWFGWYGFNPGSGLALDENTFYTAITTTYAAAAGGLAGLFTSWGRDKHPDMLLSLNGALGGLVAICSGVNSVSIVGSIIIGALAGTALVLSDRFVECVLKVDDPVGALSVHGCSGIIGVLAVGLFACRETDTMGLFYGGGIMPFLIQLLGIVAVAAFVLLSSTALFAILKATLGIRVDLKEEIEGLDINEHAIRAYAYGEKLVIPMPKVPASVEEETPPVS